MNTNQTFNSYLIIPKKYFSRIVLPYEVLPLSLCCKVNGEYYLNRDTVGFLFHKNILNEDYVVISCPHKNDLQYKSLSEILTVFFVSDVALKSFIERSYSNFDPYELKLDVLSEIDSVASCELELLDPVDVDKIALSEDMSFADALTRQLHKLLCKSDNEYQISDLNFSSIYDLAISIIPFNFDSEVEEKITYTFFKTCTKYNIDKGWPEGRVIEDFNVDEIDKSLIFEEYEKWRKVVDRLIKGENLKVPFTDEGNIVLRAMTLVLLNPSLKSLRIMKESLGADLGDKVYSLSKCFAEAREGYSLLDYTDRKIIGKSKQGFQELAAKIYNTLREGGASELPIEHNFLNNAEGKSNTNLASNELINESWLVQHSLNCGQSIYTIKGVRPLSGFHLHITHEDELLKFFIIDYREKGPDKLTKSFLLKLLQVQVKLPSGLKFCLDEQGLYLLLPHKWQLDSSLKGEFENILDILEPLKLKRKVRKKE